MANSNISVNKAFLATLLVSGGVVVLAVISSYRGVVEVKLTPTSFEFRVDGREVPKSLPEAVIPESVQDVLEDEEIKHRC